MQGKPIQQLQPHTRLRGGEKTMKKLTIVAIINIEVPEEASKKEVGLEVLSLLYTLPKSGDSKLAAGMRIANVDVLTQNPSQYDTDFTFLNWG